MIDDKTDDLPLDERMQKAINAMRSLNINNIRISENLEYVMAETLLSIAQSLERQAEAQERLVNLKIIDLEQSEVYNPTWIKEIKKTYEYTKQ